MKLRTLVAAAFAGAVLVHGGAASAANYFESISADPATFTCKIANGLKSCGAYTLFTATQPAGAAGQFNGGSGFFTAATGDNVMVDVSYSSPVHVPNSKTVSLVYVDLYDFNTTTMKASLPQEPANVFSTLIDYSGPGGYYFAFQEKFYSASAGHYFAAGTPGAFSIDGMDSSFGIVAGDANPIILAAYGFQVGVPEPSTWAMMLLGFGGLGAVLRGVRKRALAAG